MSSTLTKEPQAVGPAAIERWCRPACFQNWPQDLLPGELRGDVDAGGARDLVEGAPAWKSDLVAGAFGVGVTV